MADIPVFKNIYEWIKIYGSAGVPDQRAVQDYMECETSEKVRALQYELTSMASGNFVEEILDINVGVNRKLRHGSYSVWAKLMLLWIASYKK